MKRLCAILTVLTFLLVFGLAISAQAVPMLPVGPSFFQFNNIEQVDQAAAQSINVPGINPLTGVADYGTTDNWGLFNLSSIQDGAVSTPHNDISGGPVIWLDDGAPADPFGMGQVTGIFYDVTITSGTTATGGILDLYYRTPSQDVVDASYLDGSNGPNAATVAAFIGTNNGVDTTFLTRLLFAPGILDGDNVTTLLSSTDITSPTGLSGKADAFASVDPSLVGAWTLLLDQDWFWVDTDGDGNRGEAGELRDVRFSNFYNQQTLWDGAGQIKGLRSNDPGRAFTPIPEPTTMLLFGTGLVGLVGIARRRLRKKG